MRKSTLKHFNHQMRGLQDLPTWRLAIRCLIAASLSACGGGGGGSVAPSPVGPPMTPTVDVSGIWWGSASDSTGHETIVWTLMLDGNSVTGSGARSGGNQANGGDRSSTITGTLSGATLTFAVQWGGNCVRTITGTANVTTAAITGNYSGSTCNSPANGMLTLKRWDLTGTWPGGTADMRPGIGPGTFSRQGTWQLTQNGDSVTGSMPDPSTSTATSEGLPVPISATFSNTTSTLTFSSTYPVFNGRGGVCPETISGTAKLDLSFAPVVLTVPNAQLSGPYAGSNCLTSIDGGVNVHRNGS
jgi:hypothetical protein